MLRYTGMCRPNELVFQILRHGAIFVKKSLKGFHFTEIVKKQSNQLLFEGEKSLDMGKGFRPRAADTPSKCNLSTLHPS